jgi:peroxiredoxin
MRHLWLTLGCAAGLLVLGGCGDNTTGEKTKTKSPAVVPRKTDGEKTKTAVALPPKLKPRIEKSLFSAEEEATLLVKQDDQFPDAKLKDLAGADRALSQLRGERATVVLLWTDQSRAGRGALKAVSARAAQNRPGLHYVGIYVGDDATTAKQLADENTTSFPVLVDRERSLFKQAVKPPEGQGPADVLPRVYLLDPAGKVLWLSLALQNRDEVELDLALRFVLGEQPAKAEGE